MPNNLGYLVDSRDPRDRVGLSGLSSMPTASQHSADLSQYRKFRLEQGMASSCVAFAISQAIAIRCEIQGKTLTRDEVPSQHFIYYQARKEATASRGLRNYQVTDIGSYPRLAMQAIRRRGFCAESDCRYDDRAINALPLIGSTRAKMIASGNPGLVYSRLSNLLEIEASLKSGFPVIFGATVGDKFMNQLTDTPFSGFNIGTTLGGHMMLVLAVEKDKVLIDNWWGRDRGLTDGSGMLYVEPKAFNQDVYDIYALNFVP